MSRESRFALRLPAELYERIRSKSEQAGISINEYIGRTLADSFGGQSELERRVTELEETLNQLRVTITTD